MIPAFLKRHAWLLFAAVVFFTLLGQRGLNEPDEGRYGEIAREMSVSGDWLVPHLNGMPHFQKPPIIYWLTAASLRTFGLNEWAARLPSACAALGIVILSFLLARRLLPTREQAVATALILTTFAGFFAMSRLLTPDMTMAFWILSAITAAMYQRRWLFFITMGVGFLTKGPMALVVPICAIVGWELTASPAEKLRLPWWRGLTITLAISLSWFVALSIKDAQLFEYFWRYELVDRVASKAHGRSKPFWFFAVVLPLVLLPWTFYIPFRRAWQRCRTWTLTPWQGMALGWTLPPLLILSCSGSKLPTYPLPLSPAFALIIAAGLRDPRRVWRIALTTALLLIAGDFVIAHSNDRLGVQASSRELGQILRQELPSHPNAIVFACETRTEGLAFYADHDLNITQSEADFVGIPSAQQREHLYLSPADCAARLTDDRPAYGIVRTDRFATTFLPTHWRPLAHSGAFTLITNQRTSDPVEAKVIADSAKKRTSLLQH